MPFKEEHDVNNLKQAGPCGQCRGRTEARGDERLECAARHREMWDNNPEMHAYATGPDLDALITRPHGDPA